MLLFVACCQLLLLLLASPSPSSFRSASDSALERQEGRFGRRLRAGGPLELAIRAEGEQGGAPGRGGPRRSEGRVGCGGARVLRPSFLCQAAGEGGVGSVLGTRLIVWLSKRKD